jgi:hypothetical protein
LEGIIEALNRRKMNCKNCGHRVEGNFCSHCGQKSNISRINFPNFINEVSESFFQIDKGFFYTLRELSVRPGKSINEFLNGKRKSHFKPVAYLLTLSTVYFLTTQITNQNTLIVDVTTGWMKGVTLQDSDVELPEVATWVLKNYAYLTLLLLPVFSLASYLSFFKFDKTYLEHLIVNSYTTGHQAIFYSLFVVGETVIDGDVMEILSILVAVLYTFWVFWQLFSEGNRMMNILRSIMTYILYFIFCMFLLAALALTVISES